MRLLPAARHRARRLARPLARELLLRHARESNPASAHRDTVVFAPHPDDEVLGCGAAILLKRSTGARVRIVFITDGTASRHPPELTPDELGALRRSEALAASTIMGVPSDDVVFLGFQDSSLGGVVPGLTLGIRHVLDRYRPQEVFVTAAIDGHPDHRAACHAVRAACRGRAIEVLEYPVWLWNRYPAVGSAAREVSLRRLLRTPMVKLDATPYLPGKREAFAQYRSRTGIGGDLAATWFGAAELYITDRRSS